MAEETIPEAAKRFQQRVTSVEPAFREAINELRQRFTQEIRRQIERGIYSKPEDVDPRTGRKLWERTGNLKAGEAFRIENGGDLITLEVTNPMPYARRRHEANKPGEWQINPYRTAHWRDDAVNAIRPYMQAQMHGAQLRWLSQGAVHEASDDESEDEF